MKEFFCIKCACRSSDPLFFWDKQSKHKCGHDYCDNNNVCHHFEVDDDEELDRKRLMLSEILQCNGNDYSDVRFIEEEVADKTEMSFDPSVTNQTSNSRHIDFDFAQADHALRTAFCAQIKKEFDLRGWSSLSYDGSLMTVKQKVAKLKDSLMNGRSVKVLRDSIKRIEDEQDGFLFGLDKAVPCILHMENRVNEKLVGMTLLEGLKHRTNGAQSKEYFEEVAHIFNNGMLSEKNGNWKVPQDSGELKVLSFSNVTARRLVSNIHQVFEVVFRHHNDDGARQKLFNTCLIELFPPIIATLRQRHSFTDEEIDDLQRNIDKWYHSWMSIAGVEGMTNYIHLLGAGHVSYYLKKYRNLYRYSNQSWERLNKRVKRFYLQRTQRGGHGKFAGKDDTNQLVCQHTKPIARWLQRVIMWNTGLGEKHFKDLESKKK